MRVVGVYPRMVGGDGSMVLRYIRADDAEAFDIRNFAIVEEDNLNAIVSG